MTPSICAITGANGYLGSQLYRTFEKKGWTVYSLVRKTAGEQSIPYTLNQPIDPEAFRSRNIEVLIHCAYDASLVSWEKIHATNVQGSIRLFEAAKAGGVRKLIFISSTSAHEDTKSLYGKAKLEVEQFVLKLGGDVVRPGLLYSEVSQGLMGKIEKMAGALPALPVLLHPNRPLFLAHTEDVAELVAYLATHEMSQHLWVAADALGWTLGQIVQQIAQNRHKKIWTLPIPWQLPWLGLKALETVGLAPSFKSDSILGLVYASEEPPKSTQLPVPFRAFGKR